MTMNVLFLTMLDNMDINSRGIYNDLMRRFRDDGHKVYIVCTVERRMGRKTYVKTDEGVKILHVRTLNLQKTTIVEKGLGQLSIEQLFKRAIKKYFAGVAFDLILYSTPPITFSKVIEYAKKTNPMAMSYLLLKDIFPQNAVDLGLLKITGVKGLLYKLFRKKEKRLYELSDYIGCMSLANVRYVIEHNPQVNPKKVEVAPNSLELVEGLGLMGEEDHSEILKKYELPTDKPILIYGGNLGIAQGIPFLIECLDANKDREDCHILVIGDGLYYQKLEDWYKVRVPKAVTVMKGLPKTDYDKLVRACQVGLIFLDFRFTIPNFPSRLLSYLEYKMPVICATDPNCDMGVMAEENGFGYYAPSNDVRAVTAVINRMLASDLKKMGEKGYEFLKKNFLVENTYNAIIKHL